MRFGSFLSTEVGSDGETGQPRPADARSGALRRRHRAGVRAGAARAGGPAALVAGAGRSGSRSCCCSRCSWSAIRGRSSPSASGASSAACRAPQRMTRPGLRPGRRMDAAGRGGLRHGVRRELPQAPRERAHAASGHRRLDDHRGVRPHARPAGAGPHAARALHRGPDGRARGAASSCTRTCAASLNAGASFGQIEGVLSIVNPLLSFDQWKKIKELWRTVREGWSPGN